MLRDIKAVEYTLEILRALHHQNGAQYNSAAIFDLVKDSDRLPAVSKTYIQKMLSRMVKAGLLNSSDSGYTLANPVDEITVDLVLNICDMPDKNSPLYSLCDGMKQGVSLTTIDEFYDFSS